MSQQQRGGGEPQTLYDILGVSNAATKSELTKQYRQLALRNHPDRNPNDPSATQRFQELQHAYEILNDPNKRAAYDRFGESGVAALDNEFASPFVQVVGGPAAILFAVVLTFFLIVSALMSLAGIAAKLDTANHWGWVHSFFGVWVFDVVLAVPAVLHLIAVFSALRDGEYKAAGIMFGFFAVLGSLISWTALIATNLDNDNVLDRRSWMISNSPGLVSFGLIFLAGFEVTRTHLAAEAEAFHMSKIQQFFLGLFRVLAAACPFTLILLISLKADAALDTTKTFHSLSWYVVLAPAFAFTLLRGLSSCFSSLLMSCRGAEGWNGVFCRELISWMLGHLLYLVGVGLVAEKLVDPAETTRKWGVTFIPWFLILALATLLSCFFICSVPAMMEMMTMPQDFEQASGTESQQGQGDQEQQSSQEQNNNSRSASTAAASSSTARLHHEEEEPNETSPTIPHHHPRGNGSTGEYTYEDDNHPEGSIGSPPIVLGMGSSKGGYDSTTTNS